MTAPARIALALIALGPTTVSESRAADPQPYAVKIAPTGHADLDKALHDTSSLISLAKTAPAGPFALVIRAKTDADRFVTALQSFGYYDGTVTITVAGHRVDDPTLPDFLQNLPKSPPAEIDVGVKLGPLFHLRHVTVEGAVPADVRAQLAPVAPGAPAVASEVLAARGRMLDKLREDGHALAKVDQPVAYEIPAEKVLDVTYKVDAGPRVDLGPITMSGLKQVNESFLRRRLLIHQGEQFSPSKIEEARQDLASTGVFSTVRVVTPDHLDPDGQLPITFQLIEGPRHSVGFTAAYSTDLGISAGVTWSHHNLFGNAEQLNLHATGTDLGGTATNGMGYDIGAQFIKPDFLHRDQNLEFDLQALKENLESYDRTAEIAGAYLRRKFTPHIQGSIGVVGTQETVTQEGVTRDYTLLALPLQVKYDTTDSLFAPTHGVRAAVTATPTQSFGNSTATFAILQAQGSTYFNLDGKGRSVLALRALIGSVQGASTFDLPPDQRFYAGGSGTIRGYKFQSVGPQFPDHNPIGGTSIDAATIEFRQRVWGNFGAAAFVDAGQVGSTSAPFQGTVRVGAGGGVRYFTPIGPIRLDVGFPLNKMPGGDTFELYIGLGEAF